jgi:enoyl-CoA hydratase/carnithine racemase
MSADPEFFLFETPREHVARITINRPEVRNALHPAAHKEWSDLLDLIEEDDDIWVVIITGSGDKAFCAGRDLKHMAASRSAGADAMAADQEMTAATRRLIERFEFAKPLIAQVNGHAFGGGFEVALACDLIVAADHVNFGLPEPRRGIYAGGGGAHRLPRQIPHKLAMEYLLTGNPMTAQRALELGLVNRVVPYADLETTVDEIVSDILLNAPLSVRATKEAAMQGLDRPLAEAFDQTYPAVERMSRSKDAREGPLAFAEKREPNWSGR